MIALGSPPHTRGKGFLDFLHLFVDRITPAHAGKSCKSVISISSQKDHPRTRGEKLMIWAIFGKIEGSPPHTRGKAFGAWWGLATDRITPAHAGKRPEVTDVHGTYGDHPRTRGEKRITPAHRLQKSGSPPHTRGKVPSDVSTFWKQGITPAHAGKRLVCRA